MPKVTILNQQGENVGSLTLGKEVWGIEPNNQAMFDAVILAQANSRQDTSKTKKRDEVSGGGKKPWRQKGTGRARQGSTRSPQWRHGGIVFGPTGDQNHTLKMNKQVRSLALRSALSQKVKDKELIVVDKIDLKEIKTKEMVNILNAVKATAKKVLLIVDDNGMTDEAIFSACNIKNVCGILYTEDVNTYDVMYADQIVITQGAVEILEEVA